MLIDSHCHIHDSSFFTPDEAEAAYMRAVDANVQYMILVGTSLEDSKNALRFARLHPEHCRVSVGIHPHEAVKYTEKEIQAQLEALEGLVTDRLVVAVGECGFDFYYNDPAIARNIQTILLRGQLDIATRHSLPVIFHVRNAFDDFWPVYKDYTDIRGVLHSFTDSPVQLERALEQHLYIGVGGIATFTKQQWQQQLFKTLPLENIVIETDAPFLTPKPKRGTINEPKNVIYITQFLAELREQYDKRIISITTANARSLFRL